MAANLVVQRLCSRNHRGALIGGWARVGEYVDVGVLGDPEQIGALGSSSPKGGLIVLLGALRGQAGEKDERIRQMEA